MYTNACLKCKEKYEDTDPEPYYCPPCNEQRKAVAAAIDAKTPRAKRYVPSFEERMAALPKIPGTNIPMIT